MKTKELISLQLEKYEKSYEKTKDLKEFKLNILHSIQDVEEITPVSPYHSSFLFQVKLDCENMTQSNALTTVQSLKTFLERLNS